MSLFAQFATNREAEVEGVLVTFGASNEDGSVASFRISRMGRTNKRYQKMLEVETKPHRHAMANDSLPTEVDEAITMKLFTHTILLDWQNVIVPEVFGTDEKVPFTPENAEKLMKALPDLYVTLRQQASSMSLFRAKEIELDSKI